MTSEHTEATSMRPKTLAITGGVGGAKLALGLADILSAEEVLFAVNTADDFEHFGLHISPDVDTLTYTLAQLANTEYGWGREDESWNFMAAMGQLGGETWFNLGDRDLALHLRRSQLLRAGRTLTEATEAISQALGIAHDIVPMSDDRVQTIVATADGDMSFQHYFVREACKPKVQGFRFDGVDTANPSPLIMSWLAQADLVVICPSNPFVSVDPMLNLPGMRDALKNAQAKVIAVSPIVGGDALKGPTAKMMRELNIPSMADEVAEHYGDLLDGFVLDELDKFLHGQLALPTHVCQTVMQSREDKVNLAQQVLEFHAQLRAA